MVPFSTISQKDFLLNDIQNKSIDVTTLLAQKIPSKSKLKAHRNHLKLFKQILNNLIHQENSKSVEMQDKVSQISMAVNNYSTQLKKLSQQIDTMRASLLKWDPKYDYTHPRLVEPDSALSQLHELNLKKF